ncbi:uncharacterized protein KD926_005703 [Aspergillus affinis]|uniref:uncharacterized protein n=1 Tax=Aspergillus affinis TaxID=1070780 RepID=UPI0022FE4B79|nr:uncharacterized protein KD926_005703 [Aspergillus affinis]KAI9034754.1 hypothetical protein KD926_005703 [Aspergillus affinis]
MRIPRRLPALGKELADISLDPIRSAEGGYVAKAGVEVLTSYNLLRELRGEGAMVVPGFPPIWDLDNMTTDVKPDKGRYVTDPARARFPRFPLEPLFRALRIMKPAMKLNEIDVISDRRNLRELMNSTAGTNPQRPCRVGIRVVKNTILLSREVNPKTFVVRRNSDEWGYEFEKAYTRQPFFLKNSETHHRAISYTLGDVRTIVRYEVDGCIASEKMLYNQPPASKAGRTSRGDPILQWGRFVDPSRIVEIKTGSRRTRFYTGQILEQLWLGDTPFLCAGRHTDSGLFTRITQENCIESGKLRVWEERNQDKLKRFAALLRLIVDTVRSASCESCALVVLGDRLKFFEVPNPHERVPIDLESMWN